MRTNRSRAGDRAGHHTGLTRLEVLVVMGVVGLVPLPTGLQTLTTNLALSWGPRAHARAGNLAFADGSIQRTTNAILSELLLKQGLATNRVLLP